MKILLLCCALFVGQVSVAEPARAQSREETVTIEGYAAGKMKVLVERFAPGLGATPNDTKALYEVVISDLDYSDYFRFTEIPSLGPEDQIPAGEAQALIRATVEVSQGELVLRGSIEELPDRTITLARNYRGTPALYRELAHRFADDIVLFLTGEPGVARTRIAFVSDRTGNKEIWAVDYDGKGLTQLTRNGSINLSPAWSPDLASVAFVSYAGGDPDIHALDVASGESRRVIGGPGVQGAPAYSPDGSRMAYSNTSGRESEIYVCRADGSRANRISRSNGINTSPDWSPDGRRLVFTSDRAGTPQIYVIDAEGGGQERLTFNGKWNDLAGWSPTLDRIAYAYREEGLFRIARVAPSGLGGEAKLTYGPGSDEDPSWAPNGRHLVFSSTRSGQKGIYVLHTDSGRVRPLVVGGGNHYGPSWSAVPAR